MIEDQDFEVIPEIAYNLLINIHNTDGSEIMRYSIAVTEDNCLTELEIYLQVITISVLPKLHDGPLESRLIYTCRKETVNDLRLRLLNILTDFLPAERIGLWISRL